MDAQQMHAAVLHGTGQTPRYEPFPAPVAGDGEAVVTVAAAALKPSDRLMANGVHYAPATFPQVAGAVIRVDQPRDELAAGIAAEGPYDLVVDYLWGAPAEAVFAALPDAGAAPERIRYVLVGMSAGEVAGLPAMALRRAPVQIFGSGIGGRAGLAESAAAYDGLLKMAAAGEIALDVDPVPLADIEKAWAHPDGGRRVVFVP